MDNALNRMWSISAGALLAGSLLALWSWPKFFGVDTHPIFGWAEAQTGAGWLEPGLRYAVGALAAVVALLVLLPKTRLIGAWSALAMSTAFVVAHMTPMLGVNVPSYTPLMEALAAGRTVAEINALALPTDKGAHFTLALVNLGLAAVTVAAEFALRRPKARTLAQTLASRALASREFSPA